MSVMGLPRPQLTLNFTILMALIIRSLAKLLPLTTNPLGSTRENMLQKMKYLICFYLNSSQSINMKKCFRSISWSKGCASKLTISASSFLKNRCRTFRVWMTRSYWTTRWMLLVSSIKVPSTFGLVNKFWLFTGNPQLEDDFNKLKKMQDDFGRVATHQDKDEEEVRKLKAENARFENEVKNFREVNLLNKNNSYNGY